MMIANVKGEFHRLRGVVKFDPADPSSSSVEASMDASTISTRDPQRDAHLKSPDFLDVEKFPTITFHSKKVTATDGDGFTVLGDLTIHGVTKEVNLHVKELTSEVTDPWGNVRRGATAKTRINRKDFGIVYPGMPDDLIKDEVLLKIDLAFKRS